MSAEHLAPASGFVDGLSWGIEDYSVAAGEFIKVGSFAMVGLSEPSIYSLLDMVERDDVDPVTHLRYPGSH
jgi:hypothetical protein